MRHQKNLPAYDVDSMNLDLILFLSITFAQKWKNEQRDICIFSKKNPSNTRNNFNLF